MHQWCEIHNNDWTIPEIYFVFEIPWIQLLLRLFFEIKQKSKVESFIKNLYKIHISQNPIDITRAYENMKIYIYIWDMSVLLCFMAQIFLFGKVILSIRLKICTRFGFTGPEKKNLYFKKYF